MSMCLKARSTYTSPNNGHLYYINKIFSCVCVRACLCVFVCVYTYMRMDTLTKVGSYC